MIPLSRSYQQEQGNHSTPTDIDESSSICNSSRFYKNRKILSTVGCLFLTFLSIFLISLLKSEDNANLSRAQNSENNVLQSGAGSFCKISCTNSCIDYEVKSSRIFQNRIFHAFFLFKIRCSLYMESCVAIGHQQQMEENFARNPLAKMAFVSAVVVQRVRLLQLEFQHLLLLICRVKHLSKFFLQFL